MKTHEKSIKVMLWVLDAVILLFILLSVALPFLITTYVEVKGRPMQIAATVMIAYYPCVPFAFTVLISLRKLIKNLISGEVFSKTNVTLLRRISSCCLCAGLIMLIAGYFYMPFLVAGVAIMCCALIIRVIKNLFYAASDKEKND
ncbi:MAG: DUF2975 domain-containing protein [Clostridia bacterium]|nr:DUF2975 domain-containing protein [Clostridia bacterium]